MPRVSDDHRRAQRARIHDATVRVMLEKGVQGVGMADIIRESGLSAGAIYGYFRSKDELLAEVARVVVADRVQTMQDIAARTPVPPPYEAVREFADALPTEFVEKGLAVDMWALAARTEALRAYSGERFRCLLDACEQYLAAYAQQTGVSAKRAAPWAATVAPLLLAILQGQLVQMSILGTTSAGPIQDALEQLPLLPPERE